MSDIASVSAVIYPSLSLSLLCLARMCAVPCGTVSFSSGGPWAHVQRASPHTGQLDIIRTDGFSSFTLNDLIYLFSFFLSFFLLNNNNNNIFFSSLNPDWDLEVM